ncbi:MAG: hypothetical protein ACXVCY_12845 [Pseudobdellovibrionaceae bacterium]
MGLGRFKHLSKISSTELDLDFPAEELRQKIFERIVELKKNGKKPVIYERILDIRQDRVRSLWNKINSITRDGKLSDGKLTSMFHLLTTGIDIHKSAWVRNDTRSAKEQKENIKEIGNLADRLFAKLYFAKDGYVMDFLRHWKVNEAKTLLEFDELVSIGSHPELSSVVYARQSEIIDSHLLSPALLFGLKTLSISAIKYCSGNQKIPKSQIGLSSQKKSELVFFVSQIHVALEQITGKPHFGINADLSSIVLEKNISVRRVEEIVERARKRGEISLPKSKKSPRT